MMFPLAALDLHATAFYLYAAVACVFAIAVVLTHNVVRMAFYLMMSLGATAGLFFLAGAEFVGAMQLMIYVGGTLVLLIFGVMLTAQARFVTMQTSGAEWVMAAILGSTLLLLLLNSAFSISDWYTPRADRESLALIESHTTTPVGMALTGVRVDKLDEPSERLRGGMSGYLLPFVIISMHLLVVLIGAGYMARNKRLGVGVAAAQPAAATRPDRRAKFSVTAGIASGIGMNLVLAAICFLLAARTFAAPAEGATARPGLEGLLARGQELLATAPGWLLPTLGALFLANVLLLAVVYGWQRWGVIGLVIVPLLMGWAIDSAGLGSDGRTVAVVLVVLTLAPVAALIALICSGPKPTMWERME
jgi:NADH-quinone oxidoreductase subunit J